jgi:DNA-binding transcriptional ArsR family regulator
MTTEPSAADPRPPLPPWTLVTSHGLVLLFIAGSPNATIREISENLELTERRIADVIRDLERAKMITVTREGRRNRYALNPDAHFLHPLMAAIPIKSFISIWKREVARRRALRVAPKP